MMNSRIAPLFFAFAVTLPGQAPAGENEGLLLNVEEFDPVYRGAADISHVADYGDALDGVGSRGSNNHEIGERVEMPSLAISTKRATLLMYRLTR